MGRMDEWPAWQRWTGWMLGWVLYLGSFWLLFATDNLIVRMVALAILCLGLLVLTHASRAILNERTRKIDRWQMRVTLPAFIVYMLLVLYGMPLVEHTTTPWLKAVVVLSPVVPLIFVAWAMVRYVNRCDELERRQHLEAAGIALVLVSLVSVALGFLAAAKLIVVDGAIALLLVLPALCVVYGLACAWSKWRNRAR